jgi:CheY-like chemotaxis protein
MGTCNPILIVEDERDARETLQQLLRLEGFSSAVAANGKEGLEKLEEFRPCMILLDLMMPVMNGWEFLETLRKSRQDVLQSVPVVVISAAADVGDIPRQLGCRTMKKPLDLDQLFMLAQQHCKAS